MNRTELIGRNQSGALPKDFVARDPQLSLIQIAIHQRLTEVDKDWRNFEANAAGTFYQTYAWCAAWIESTNEPTEPRIIIGRDRSGSIRFLLPFCIQRRYGVSVLEWIATPQTTYGYGLFDREFLPRARAWFSGRGWEIVRTLNVDAVNLAEMPASFHGFPHPLSDWFSCEGANRGYQILLEPSFQNLYERKRSSATRRSNRKRDNKLAGLGELHFGLPEGQSRKHGRIDEMFRQQEQRLSERGIHGVFDARDRLFVHRLAEAEVGGAQAILAYNLSVDQRMVAMKLGGLFGNTYWGLISSLDSDFVPHLSPGDAALRRLIAACCDRNLAVLDLASGDAAYKSQWADKVIPLHACIRGLSLRGYFWAAIATARLITKRTIKRSPQLWRLVQHLRRGLAHLCSRALPETPLSCLVSLNLAGIA